MFEDEIECRQELRSMLEPYGALTELEQQLAAHGDIIAMVGKHLPMNSSQHVRDAIGFSDMPVDVKIMYFLLLPALGVDTWEDAMRLHAGSPCLQDVPPGLVTRLLNALEKKRIADERGETAPVQEI
eukprot:TRINITY_DN1444_c0_g1_i2.p2 TRINITY_DN1444_c0_g1~~TRINITY_DN1444_c0_g1_i2.p2  ORF type:complete len:127 (+),score=19.16 TRINITY_DN1444_c0_g1_i2:364-744(+)